MVLLAVIASSAFAGYVAIIIPILFVLTIFSTDSPYSYSKPSDYLLLFTIWFVIIFGPPLLTYLIYRAGKRILNWLFVYRL